MTNKFSYDGLFTEKSEDLPMSVVEHAKYDFAVAYPAPETLPMDGLVRALQVAVDARGDEIARQMAYYPHVKGSPELREFTSYKLDNDRGFKLNPDDIVLTNGSGEAIQLIIHAITDPGDTVITEQYVYGGTFNQLKKAQADIVGTPVDDQGIIPNLLDELIMRLIKENRKPKYLYSIPEHQNPMGPTLPLERKKQILEILNKYSMPVIEDECYVDLRFEGQVQPPFRALDDSGIVIYIGSYSKLLAPGLRLGYFVAPEELTRRAMSFRHGSGPNLFGAYAIEGFLSNNLDAHRGKFNPLLKQKKDSMVNALEDNFSGTGATWSNPEGGCYLWLTLPEGSDICSIRDDIFNEGVGYLGGTNFAPNNDGQNCARLCFAFESPQKNREGIELFSHLLKKRSIIKN
jgi:2-aminoadipate transaminase